MSENRLGACQLIEHPEHARRPEVAPPVAGSILLMAVFVVLSARADRPTV
jgi:hypothetical protein